MITIAVHGGGRMAREIVNQAHRQADCEIAAIVSRSGAAWAGEIPVLESLHSLGREIDVLVDFTLGGGPQAACNWCAETGTALLSGTTGLQASDKDALEAAAKSVPVLWAPNLSIGINLVQQLVVHMASALGHEATIEIEDIHHAGKKDAPSGTALMLADAAARARGDHDTDEIEMSSTREGDETGRHQVRFSLPGEQIEITHHAGNRSIYAIGALQASRWLPAQNAGLYTAADFLKSFAG